MKRLRNEPVVWTMAASTEDYLLVTMCENQRVGEVKFAAQEIVNGDLNNTVIKDRVSAMLRVMRGVEHA